MAQLAAISCENSGGVPRALGVGDLIWGGGLAGALLAGALHNFAGVVAFSVLGLMALLTRRGRLPKTPVISATLAVAVIVFALAVLPSEIGFQVKLEEAARFASYVLFACALASASDRSKVAALIVVLALVTFTGAVYLATGAFSLRGDYGGLRFSSIFSHPNHLAYVCAFTGITFAAMLMSGSTTILGRRALFVAILIALWNLLLTKSSGGVIAFCVGMAILVTTVGRPGYRLAAVALVIVGCIGVMSFTDVTQLLAKKISVIDSIDVARRAAAYKFGGGFGSFAWRMTYWYAIVSTHLNSGLWNVLCGAGGGAVTKGNYVYFFMVKDAHNDFVKIFVEYGLVGLTVLTYSISKLCARPSSGLAVGGVLLAAMFSGNTIGIGVVMGTFFVAASLLGAGGIPAADALRRRAKQRA